MKWRIDPVFSLDELGHPVTNYMVQKKRFLGPWLNVQMFVDRREAEKEIQIRKRLTLR